MKKIIIGLLMFLSLIVTGCSSKLNGYTEISYNELMKKIENKESFPLVIGSSECSACANYEIVMKKFISDYQIEVFEIDLTKLSENEYDKLMVDTSFTGTPTTLFYKEGKLTSYYNRIGGSESRSVVEDYFKNNGYIK